MPRLPSSPPPPLSLSLSHFKPPSIPVPSLPLSAPFSRAFARSSLFVPRPFLSLTQLGSHWRVVTGVVKLLFYGCARERSGKGRRFVVSTGRDEEGRGNAFSPISRRSKRPRAKTRINLFPVNSGYGPAVADHRGVFLIDGVRHRRQATTELNSVTAGSGIKGRRTSLSGNGDELR